MLCQPIFQVKMLHPTDWQNLFPIPVHTPYHRVMLVNVQCNVAAMT
jgi:hypothetical protein